MNNRFHGRGVLFLLVTAFVALTIQLQPLEVNENVYNVEVPEEISRLERIKRATAHKPGFFKTLFSVIYDQWTDTRSTINKVNELVNDNFLPENAPKVETTTSADPNASTTAAPYKITRSEFNRILQRNLRGLVRLYNIELRDALKQSNRINAEYQKNASAEISKFL